MIFIPRILSVIRFYINDFSVWLRTGSKDRKVINALYYRQLSTDIKIKI